MKAAAVKVRDAGWWKWDVYSPFPVNGLDGSMGVKREILPVLAFKGGAAGALIALALQWYTNAFDYQYLASGKPFLSLPVNILWGVLRDAVPERAAKVLAPRLHERPSSSSRRTTASSRSAKTPSRRTSAVRTWKWWRPDMPCYIVPRILLLLLIGFIPAALVVYARNKTWTTS